MARPISSYSIEASSIDSAAPTESRASAVAPLAAADSDASSDDENGSIVVSDLGKPLRTGPTHERESLASARDRGRGAPTPSGEGGDGALLGQEAAR